MTTKSLSKPAPLGRGLSALFGDTDASYQPRTVAQPAAAAKDNAAGTAAPAHAARMMPIAWVQPGAYQPRRHFDEEAIGGLAESIKERGILQPLMVRPIIGEKDSFEIIAGERRWRAAQKVGLHEVPVIVRSFSDREAMEIGLIENVQRQDLSPLEEAEGYRRLIEEFHHTQDGLAKVVGKSRPHITNLLRLLTLPGPVKHMIENSQLTMGHARTLITARDPKALADEIVKRGLSVRQAEALAKREADGNFAKNKKRALPKPDANVLDIEKKIESAIGLKVKFYAGANGTTGSLTLHYSSLDQLDALLKKLMA